MSKKFDELMAFCNRVNPDSITSADAERVASVTKNGLDLAPCWRGKKVLILGAADGHEVGHAVDALGWDATGLTFLEKEKNHATYPGARERLTVGDVHDLPFGDGAFDAVYSKEMFEHSPCPYLAVLESARVLKPGGEFFHLIADGWQKQRDWYHFSCLPDWLWCDLFRKAGLDVRDTFGFPDVEHCTFQNKGYFGIKVAERRLTDDAETYKAALGFAGWVGGTR